MPIPNQIALKLTDPHQNLEEEEMLHDDHVLASLDLQSVVAGSAAAASDVDDSDCIHYYDQGYHYLMKALSVSEEHPETMFEESSWRRINCSDERILYLQPSFLAVFDAPLDGQRRQKRGNDILDYYIPDDDDDDALEDTAVAEDDTPATVAVVVVADAEHAPSDFYQAVSAHQSIFANSDEPRRNSWPYWQLWRHVLHLMMRDDCYCRPS